MRIKNVKRARFALIAAAALFITASGAFSQQQTPLLMIAPRLVNGMNLYAEGRWGDAIAELRRAQSETIDNSIRAEAQFWIAMCELMAGDYSSAIHDIDETLRIDPMSRRALDAPYQKARALYYLGRHNEAVPLLRQYVDSIRVDGRYVNGVRMSDWSGYNTAIDSQDDYNRKASAIFWIGESLYAMEQYDEAESMFTTIVTQYTKSHKYEAAVNRLALIKEKRIQSSLLEIVKWNQSSQPGAQANLDSAYNAYQQQLGTIIGGGTTTSGSSGYSSSSMYSEQYSETVTTGTGETQGGGRLIMAPSAQPASPQPTTEAQGSGRMIVVPGAVQSAPKSRTYDSDTLTRLLAIKTTALEMMDRLVSLSNNYEIIDGSINYGYTVAPIDGTGTARVLP